MKRHRDLHDEVRAAQERVCESFLCDPGAARADVEAATSILAQGAADVDTLTADEFELYDYLHGRARGAPRDDQRLVALLRSLTPAPSAD